MIRSQSEYRESVRRLEAARQQAAEHEASLRNDFGPEQVERLMAPVRIFHQNLEADIRRYEQLRRGELDESWDLRDLGRLLVEARLARGLSQRALAVKLGVHESLVSRDERNGYQGITHERACQILDALGVRVRLRARVRKRTGVPRDPSGLSPSPDD